MNFKLTSKYQPTGDQPQAIRQLTEGIEQGEPAQVLLGVTGSGKTFTVANVIANVGKPTLVLSHNKTLAAQLYQEMKSFFPENAVEYSAFRTERCHRGVFCLVYLWYGRSYRHAGEHHQDKERTATRQERVSATVSGCPV